MSDIYEGYNGDNGTDNAETGEENSGSYSEYENVTDSAEELKPGEGPAAPGEDENQRRFNSYDTNAGSQNNGSSQGYRYSKDTSYNRGGYGTNESGKGGKDAYAIVSLICGILSLLCCCFSWGSLLLGVAAVVLGVISVRNGYNGYGVAVAGIITGGCGVGIAIIFILLAGLGNLAGNLFKINTYHFNNGIFDGFSNSNDFF